MTDALAALAQFDAALAGPGNAETPWRALAALTRAVVGAKLFTVMSVDMDNKLARRIFTSEPEKYPVSGSKPIHFDAWFGRVHEQRLPFVANTIAEIARVFPDHETIWALGCGAVVNLPVVLDDQVVGTLNLLDKEHFYTPERVALGTLLSLPAKASFLAAAYFRERQEQGAGATVFC